MPVPFLRERLKLEIRSKDAVNVLAVSPRPDRTTDPVAYLLIERVCKIETAADRMVSRASLCIHYQVIKGSSAFHPVPETGEFGASYNAFSNVVSLSSAFGTGGTVFLDQDWLKGRRVGTYLMNEIVEWARQWPTADVDPIELVENQASDANRERRNRFYRQFNIRFGENDLQIIAGWSRPMKVSELTPVSSWTEHVKEQPLVDFMAQSLTESELHSFKLENLKTALKNVTDGRDYLERHPFRVAAIALYSHFPLLIGVGLLSFLIWGYWDNVLNFIDRVKHWS